MMARTCLRAFARKLATSSADGSGVPELLGPEWRLPRLPITFATAPPKRILFERTFARLS